MIKKTIISISAALFSSVALAQSVQFFTPNTVRIVKDNGKAVTDSSLVVIAKPQKVKVTKKNEGDAVVYQSSELTVKVEKGLVAFYDAKGNLLTEEKSQGFSTIESGPDKGTYKVSTGFNVDADEGIYGVGLLQNGKMSQRGENRRMEQSNLEDYAHFYQSIKGYGVYWDNYSPTHLVTPEEGRGGELSLTSEVGKKIDYYFMYGKNADGVIKAMRYLTGKVPMLALWTYGFHQSRERYESSAQLLDVVRTYRKLGVPFDGIIQDWQYWGSNYTWNAMEFINPDFKNAQQMIDEVHKRNAKFHISIWASFGPHTKQFKELQDKNLLFNFETWPQSGLPMWPPRMDYPSGVKVYDAYSKDARDIYWKYLSNMHKMGVDGWWMDSTDPDHHSYKDSDLDGMCAMGSYRSVRNLFPYMTVKGVYDHQRAVDSTKRVFILTRSYFAGQQRTGANTWSGDVNSSWDAFRKQVPICLNYTLTANPNVNTDISGFFAGSYRGKYGDGKVEHNPQFQELYVRWMQFGQWCPMMRSHGTEAYREIYHYGKAGEPVYDALLNAIKMRYSLLPYIYSMSWQVSKNDDSYMRALFMDFPKDKNTWNNNRQFMFGHNILVCPVVNALYTQEQIVKSDAMTGWNAPSASTDGDGKEVSQNGWNKTPQYDVYLPAGTKWYDYWTNAVLDGGQTIKAEAPIAHSPLYVKAGSLIVYGPEVQYSNEKKWDNLDVVIYPGADATFTLYEDEGDNYNYEKGAYSTIEMKWNDKSKTLTIGKRNGRFDGMLTQRNFNVRVAGAANKNVAYKGNAVSVKM
ncbi:MAG: DUF5110 domain-containing protein [Prevotella sp.]|nr:DUF5110 domain-containing protein [Candidatus Prevotella equi]